MFHMRDPETFYNKSDAWDIAKFTGGQDGRPAPVDAHAMWWRLCPARRSRNFC